MLLNGANPIPQRPNGFELSQKLLDFELLVMGGFNDSIRL